MKAPARLVGWAFSLGAHALLLVGLLLLARGVAPVTPQACRVSLTPAAPLAGGAVARQNVAAAPPTPATPPASSTPATPPTPKQTRKVASPPAPAIAHASPRKISPHNISPRKHEAPHAPRPSTPAARSVPSPVQQTRPQPLQKPGPQTASAPLPPSVSGGQAAASGSSGPQPRLYGGLSAYEYSALDQRPGITRRIEPEYPAKARRMGVQGAVVVQLVVDAAGQPRNCTVVRATPDGFFEEAALDAVRRMRFAPGKIRGQAVNTVVRLPFSFKLQ